jgi:preprotein translocase SecE subunit
MKKVTKFFNNFGKNAKNSIFKIRNFFISAFGELKKVEWLSKKETLRYGSYILVFLFATAFTIAMLDLLFFRAIAIITS